MLKNPGIKMIEGDDKMRSKKCMTEIQVLLQQFDCELHPIVTISPMGNEYGFRIVPKSRIMKP